MKFDLDQKILQIGDIKLGGQPGELPTVLIGSLFHVGHKIVKDSTQGIFNENRAEHLINIQEEMSERTGNPHMIDIVGETSNALKKYIDFVSEITETPFLINGPNASVRTQAASHVAEIGLIDRAIYTSINYRVSREEITAIKEVGLKSAII